MMNQQKNTGLAIGPIISSENGSAIVLALMVMVMLTVFGMASLSTTDTDLHVVANEREYLQEFFTADSAWKEGGRWLDNNTFPPEEINTNDDGIVKNFGDGGADPADIDLPTDGTEDGTMNNTPYWYRVTYTIDTNVAGSGPEYRRFRYDTVASANQSQQIDVDLSKIYKIGY